MVTAARPRRTPKSPAQLAAHELSRGIISRVAHDKRRDTLGRRECSSVWAYDIWHGHDVDYLGIPRGHGHAKVRCCECGRDVPPQDTADQAMSEWHDDRERGVDRLRPRPTITIPICTDCRTRAPIQRARKTPDGDVTRQRYMDDKGAIWEQDPDAVYPDDDGSPSTPVLDAMADAEAMLPEHQLPTEDDDTLAAAVQAYAVTGDLSAYLKATGDESVAAIQRARQRYGTSRTLTV